MNTRSRFILKVIVLTILTITFLSGAIISAMMLAIKGVTMERLGLMLVSLGFTAVAVYKIISLNNRETASRIDAVVNDRHDFIAQWDIPSSLWQEYLKAKLHFDISESTSYGYISGGIIAVIFLISNATEFSVTNLIIIAIAVFLVTFLVIKLGTVAIARKRYSKFAKSGSGEIHFAKDLVIINGQLTMLDEFGYSLKAFSREEKFGFHLLSFIVETGLGHRKNQRSYFIPIPENYRDEADALVKHYASLIG